jgi:hypothetical protein
MTFSALTHTKVGGATGGTTPAIDTTGAKLIVISAAYSGAATISDSNGNTYTLGLSRGSSIIALYYCINPAVGSGHTFTIAASVGSITVAAFGSTLTPAVDTGVSSQGSNANGLNHTIGTSALTPSSNNGLVVSSGSFPAAYGGALAAGSGFTLADSQNYVSGTNLGCDLVYQIQTTAASISASAVTSSWASSALVSDSVSMAFKEVVPPTTINLVGANLSQSATISTGAVSITAGGSGTVSITNPVSFAGFQRAGVIGSIPITGTVTGAAEDIEASFNGGAYQTIASSVAAGSFSGTLTGQAQGQGTLSVRKKVTTSALATVGNVGIGDVFLIGGDSISEGRGASAQSYSHATLKATDFRQDDAWKDGNDPTDTGTSVGSHWPLLATHIMASQGVPVFFVSCGTGGTDVAGSNSSWAKPGGDYNVMVQQAIDSRAGSVKAVLMHLGPNAIVNSNNAAIALATYRTALDTLASNLAGDVTGAPKLHVGICGEVGTGSPPDRRTAEDNIRGAILSAWNNNGTAIKPGPVLIEQDYSDNVHPITTPQLQLVADRWWAAINQSLYGGANGRGPRLSSAQWNTGRTVLTVTFDRALKTGLTFATQPWIVKDNGAAMTVSGIAYHGTNASAILITTSAAATGPANTTTLTFASGDDAAGRVIPISTDITLPSAGTVNLPAEPIYAAAVAELVAGTITHNPLARNTDSGAAGASRQLWANETGLTMRLYSKTTGQLLTTKTGWTTDSAGIPPATSDALLVAGAGYHVIYILANGVEGFAAVVAV